MDIQNTRYTTTPTSCNITFTEEIFNGKIHFLCNVVRTRLTSTNPCLKVLKNRQPSQMICSKSFSNFRLIQLTQDVYMMVILIIVRFHWMLTTSRITEAVHRISGQKNKFTWNTNSLSITIIWRIRYKQGKYLPMSSIAKNKQILGNKILTFLRHVTIITEVIEIFSTRA